MKSQTCNQLATVAKDICVPCKDSISRQAAIDAINDLLDCSNAFIDSYDKYAYGRGLLLSAERNIKALPSAQPELTDDRAIEHLQSTGWMQNHDREMYESGLREQLADDNGSYDGLIPCEDTISRQAAIDTLYHVDEYNGRSIEAIRNLPSAQPEIIHCKDCKNSEHWYRDRRRCFLWSEDGVSVLDSGFCNYAERRTDDER